MGKFGVPKNAFQLIGKAHERPKMVTKADRNVLKEALARLAKLKDEEPNKIPVPWERVERPKLDSSEWAESRLENFEIESLYASQRWLKRDDVEWHIENYDHVPDGQHMNPNVVLTDGKAVIYDGHHRLAALFLLGARFANCWVLER